MEFLFELGLFIAKSFWIVICIVFVLIAFGSILSKRQRHPNVPEGHLMVRHINEMNRELQRVVDMESFDPKSANKARKLEQKQRSAEAKAKRREEKAERKSKSKPVEGEVLTEEQEAAKRCVYVLDFKGDIEASKVDFLRKEITSVLVRSKAPSEVVVRVESSGGYVHSYGLAASQLLRLRESGIKLTVAVDQLAASGGYMMAAVADHIIAAPFALIGSIGVAAEIPNVYRFLQKFDIDYEVLTAGKHKRTMTFFGENKDEHREKLMEEMEETHELFQEFVSKYRTDADIPSTATGESWYGSKAMELNLVDAIQTSDQYILDACNDAEVYEVQWVEDQRPLNKLAAKFAASLSTLNSWFKHSVRAR